MDSITVSSSSSSVFWRRASHEVGHALPVKKFGVLVPDYAVGFWPRPVEEEDRRYFHVALRAILLMVCIWLVPGTRASWRRGK